jgi:hypothetical protein
VLFRSSIKIIDNDDYETNENPYDFEKRYYDENDVKFKEEFHFDKYDNIEKSPLENIDDTQYYWLDLQQMKFVMNLTMTNICALRYDHQVKKIYGLEHDPILDKNIQAGELCKEWVHHNFDKEIIDQIVDFNDPGKQKTKEEMKSINGSKYFKVPVGNANPNMIIPDFIKHPQIIFRQEVGEDSCCFKSLASAIHYLGMIDVANVIVSYWYEYKNDNCKVFDRIMQWAYTKLLHEESVHLQYFRTKHCSKCTRITKNDNILLTTINPKDILWINLLAYDGDCSHTVAVCDNYIFDSNFHNAMPLSQENLNRSCGGSNFVRIKLGYWFHYRTNTKIKQKLDKEY